MSSVVLVTGGTGFIGSWLTRKLAEQGHKVVAYSRHPDTLSLKDIEDKVHFVAGDVLDLPRLLQTIKQYRVERVIHTTTQLIAELEANPFLGYKVNVDGTMNIFEACRLMDVKRVVYLSSRNVYDLARGEHGPPCWKPIDEDYPKGPRAVYGATKLFMENMGMSYNRIYGLDFVALRFAVTYGPGKQARHALSTINKIIESGMTGQPFKLTYNIDQPDDIIYVRDIVNAVILACFAEKLQNRIFHFGMGKGVTYRQVIEAVKGICGRAPVEVIPKPETGLVAHYVLNPERARRELGYTSQYDLEASIKDYIETVKGRAITSL